MVHTVKLQGRCRKRVWSGGTVETGARPCHNEAMARLGIVGFTNSGKTTLFNALTGLDAATAPHPYNTTEPNMGVARIPDPKLEAAAKVENSAKVDPGHSGVA